MVHQRRILSRAIALGFPLAGIAFCGRLAMAQQAPAMQASASVAGADVSGGLPLAQPFESQSEGLSFRPPMDCKLTDAIGNTRYLAEWADEEHDWTLKLGKMRLDHPTPLVSTKDNFGKDVEGLLDRTVKNLRASLPGANVLRQDVTNTRDGMAVDPQHPENCNNVGLIVIRYTNQGQRRLSQQAIIAARGGVYYLLTLTTPGSRTNDDAASGAVDPKEALAANTFASMVDSIRMLDRVAIKEDQDARLYNTRSTILNWTPEKLHRLMLNEQWLRIIKDGKDVGYSYITEDQAGGIPRPLKREELIAAAKSNTKGAEQRLAPHGDGILIGVRAGMTTMGIRSDKTKGPIQTDSASWFFVSADRKHEDFSRVIVTDDHIAPKKGYVQEFGGSDRRVRRMVERPDEDQQKTEPNAIVVPDNKNAVIVSKEDWELNVNRTSNVGMAAPITRKLPPWYVSQAMAHLLPRLLPLERPQGYMFAVYVSETGEVVMRYMEVLEEQTITFNGQTMRAIPIHDRMGLQGSITTHYMGSDGAYIGSENKDQRLVLLPTNDTTIHQIWARANLTRPDAIERGGPANANAAGVNGISPGPSNSPQNR